MHTHTYTHTDNMYGISPWRFTWWEEKFFSTKAQNLTLHPYDHHFPCLVESFGSLNSAGPHPTLIASFQYFLSSDNYSLSNGISQDSKSASEPASWPSIPFSCINTLGHSQATCPSFTCSQWEWLVYVPSQTHKIILRIILYILRVSAGWPWAAVW